jgi:hypothetical protein
VTTPQVIYALLGGLGAATFGFGLVLLIMDAFNGPGRLKDRRNDRPGAPAATPERQRRTLEREVSEPLYLE